MMASAAAATPLDFASLLSRNNRPARVTRLIPREAYKEANPNNEKIHHHSHDKAAAAVAQQEATTVARDVEVSTLVMDLVSKTPAYGRHAEDGLPLRPKLEWIYDQGRRVPKPPSHEWETLPPSLHEVTLRDWEKDIRWGGADEKKPALVKTEDAAALLGRRRNPYLDALVFDDSNINWEGSREDGMEKARSVPLILEIGTAGRSIARHVLPASRPIPFGQSEEYIQRMEREWSTPATSSAELSKATLHADPEQMAALVKAKQQRRAQMAKDKSQRVTEAMGTLEVLGSGKGRTITSSLMGPGGTERTGRPTRWGGSTSHDMEYIEQLDLVYNYTLVKPVLRDVELRQYHRPRVPLTVVRKERPWQFQIRYVPSSKQADPSNNTSSYQSMMMGSHAGAASQAKIRNEADLSPSEGELVLLEYCEERPPIQLTRGMASKIVNFYRGDRSKCPVSAGGGDRPTRRKRREHTSNAKEIGSGKPERPPRLVGPNESVDKSLTDWIGMPSKRTSRDNRSDKPAIDVIPEGSTEILHTRVHGPFIGEVEDGSTQTGLISNLFVAPMFRHESESTDFLMILGKKLSGGSRLTGASHTLAVVLRSLPASVFAVGQVEPRVKVFPPNTNAERTFTTPFISYQIAKALTRTEAVEGHGLRFDEVEDHLFLNTMQGNALRQRLRTVAVYDKISQIWNSKPIGFEDYPGVEALGRRFTPEGVACYEMECSAMSRLTDLGIVKIFSGANSVAAVGLVMMYLTGQMNAAREMSRKMKKTLEFVKASKKSSRSTQVALYQKASEDLEDGWKILRRKHDVAKFIYEELQLAPWYTTNEFIEVHKNGQGTGMMQLTGLGDPSGLGEGYNFLREVDAKPHKMAANTNGALNAQIKKITGTENDLRKLTMKQMASLLRSYGMAQKDIDTLKRWDRVHVIRDLSTKAASDGMGDGLERFARGEKMKLSDQKRMYQARIREIWSRQRAALSTDAGDSRTTGATTEGIPSSVPEAASLATPVDAQAAVSRLNAKRDDDSDSDSEDDDFVAMLEEDLKDVRQTNQLVAEQVRGSTGDEEASRSLLGKQIREGGKDLSKDARELAALKRQREEERAAQEGGIGGPETSAEGGDDLSMVGKKVVRRRITKTFPDGRQKTIFKFVLAHDELNKAIQRKRELVEDRDIRKQKFVYKPDSRPVGHAIFEDEDDVDHHRSRSGIRFQVQKRAVHGSSGKVKAASRSQKGAVQLGKLKQRVPHEKRLKKRKREEEEADLYVAASKRLSTNNRRQRGSARERMPHVKLSDKLETIRNMAERKPGSEPFHRPVNRRAIPRYYEVIHDPIDLQTIRDKNQRYEYKTADAFLRDFDLMKRNAAKFNGATSLLAGEANNIYEFVTAEVEKDRAVLTALEEAVTEQLSGKKKKRKKVTTKVRQAPGGHPGSNVVIAGGVEVNLGDLSGDFNFNEYDSD